MTGTDEFAREFARTFEDRLRPAVARDDEVGERAEGGDPDARRRWLALRVLFLLFVQRRGWLDGNRTYVQDRYDAVTSDPDGDVNGDLFAPLFDALGSPGTTDHEDLGRLPFLGGPFQPPDPGANSDGDLSDAGDTRGAVDSEFYHALLDPTPGPAGEPRGLCRRYEFALGDETGAVTPADISRAFELTIGANERSEKGAFYTPGRVTTYVARTALARYLASATDATDDQATRLVVDGRPPDDPELARECENELREIAVLDPACGGGAFVVAVLDVLTGALLALAETADAQRSSDGGEETDDTDGIDTGWPTGEFALRRDVLVNSLYGVDLDRAGVEVCRFRAWLSLLRAPPQGLDAFLAGDYALPNLDRSFLVGNSLVGDHDPTRLADELDAGGRELVERIGLSRRAYATASGDRRDRLATDIERLTSALDAELGPADTGRMRELTEQIEPGAVFRWSRRLPDVVLSGGFDVVVGNPPYEGHAKQGYVRDLSELYAESHEFYETVPGMRSDLYQQFVVRGWELARDGGVLSFITSDTFLTIRSKRATRNLLRGERLTDLVLAEVAFDAAINPAVVTLRTDADPAWFNFIDARGNGNFDLFARLDTGEPDGVDGDTSGVNDAAVPITDGDGTEVGYRARADLFRDSPGGALFRPSPHNRELHRAHLKRASELAEEWADVLRDSRALEQNRSTVEREHLAALEPGDLTLLGLLVTGGVGMQVPTNDEALAYIDGSDPAAAVEARNETFRYVEPNEEGYYRMSRVITQAQVADPAALSPRERERGIAGDEHDAVWVPIEKGKGGSFYRPAVEYINWSRSAVARYHEHPRAYPRNSRHYFAEGIFAAGQGSGDPEFRYTNDRVVEHSGNILVPATDRVPVRYLLGVLCSSLSSYVVREFLNHSVNTQLSDVRRLPIRLPTDDERERVVQLVERAIATRKGQRDDDIPAVRNRLDDAMADIYDIDRTVFDDNE